MRPSQDPPLVRRNFVLCVVNGAIFMSATRLVDPGGLLSLLVLRLTDSPQMIGLMAFLASVGWFWPGIGVANLIEHKTRKLGYYQATAFIRMACLWSSAGLLFTRLPIDSPRTMFWAMALLAFLQTSASGVAYIPFMDVIGKTIPSNQRGLLFALRMLFAEVLGFGTAAVAGYLLSESSGFTYPTNFAVMLALAAAVQSIGMSTFFFVDEPEGRTPRRRLPFWLFVRRGRRVFRSDRSFRNFTYLRLLNGLGFMSMPFMAAFARQELGVAEATLGYFMAANAAAALTANLAWAKLASTRGNRAVLRGYAALAAAPTVLALVAATLPSRLVSVPFIGDTDCRAVMVGLVFFAAGLAGPGRHLGEMSYILDLAPERLRSLYLGFSHTLAAPVTLIPMMAGKIAEDVSYPALFVTALAFAGCGLWLSLRGLGEPRPASAPEPRGTPTDRNHEKRQRT